MGVALKDLVTKYGPIALGTYLSISFVTFCSLFIAIENHLDVEAVLKQVLGTGVDVETTLRAWGYTKPGHEQAGEPVTLYQYAASKAPHAALALLLSKALIPLKVPVAAALTPTVARILEARGIICKKF